MAGTATSVTHRLLVQKTTDPCPRCLGKPENRTDSEIVGGCEVCHGAGKQVENLLMPLRMVLRELDQ